MFYYLIKSSKFKRHMKRRKTMKKFMKKFMEKICNIEYSTIAILLGFLLVASLLVMNHEDKVHRVSYNELSTMHEDLIRDYQKLQEKYLKLSIRNAKLVKENEELIWNNASRISPHRRARLEQSRREAGL